MMMKPHYSDLNKGSTKSGSVDRPADSVNNNNKSKQSPLLK